MATIFAVVSILKAFIENARVIRPYSRVIAEYMASLKEHPNPPAANVTVF